MSENIYYNYGIKENLYYSQWERIFEGKEKNAQLLYSILKDEAVDDEDFSIGCQAIVSFIYIHSLYISSELYIKLVNGIYDNIKNIHWGAYNNGWSDNRRKVLIEFIEEFNTWPKIININFNPIVSLNAIIEQQLALGLNGKDVLNDLFIGLKEIAKSKYGVFPNISIPTDFSKKLEDILISLKEIERKGVDVENIINVVISLIGVKKWLI